MNPDTGLNRGVGLAPPGARYSWAVNVQLSKEGAMSVQQMLDVAGRRRSPATMPGFRVGKTPRNKGQRYPADPPTVDELVAVMRPAGNALHGNRLAA